MCCCLQDGKEIVEALISQSKSFESKTVFSQEKYRKRKAKKYIQVATVRRPTAQTVASCFFSKMPAKVCDIRPDTLAVMLGMANVGPHQQVWYQEEMLLLLLLLSMMMMMMMMVMVMVMMMMVMMMMVVVVVMMMMVVVVVMVVVMVVMMMMMMMMVMTMVVVMVLEAMATVMVI